MTGTDDAPAGAHLPRRANRSQRVTQVLIAGATGYIGGHLAPDLLRRAMHVRCLARDPSYWLGPVTPVDTGVARPLVQGLSAEMLVRSRPPAGINDAPLGFDDAVREALSEDAG